jgi:cytochrome c oxidase assembly factor CtaG
MGSILLPPHPGRGPGLLPGRATGARVVLTPSHGSTYDSEMLNRLHRLRPWLTLLAAILAAGVLLPPAATVASRYAFAQALQFVLLAVAVPALLVISAPWRMRRGIQLADRVAMARSHRGGTMRAWVYLVGFILLVIIWRLPVMVNTLARHPVLTIAEAVTLVAAGCGLWLELLESAPMLPTISRPQRAAFAALPMWTIWTLAYIMGFSRGVWFTAFAHQPGAGLGTVADQQIAAAILWAVPAVCFVPVVYTSLLSWLRDSSDPDAEFRAAHAAHGPGQAATLRPPRGWRTRSR